jgi:biopolymer transport protein ExbD
MIEFQRKKPLDESLRVAPLLDIIFLLLLFFLLTSVFMEPGIPVELPESDTAELQSEQQEVVIALSKSGEITVNSNSVSYDELSTALSTLLQSSTTRNVIVNVDKATPFDAFIRVVDAVKQAGGEDLIISAVTAE